MTTNPHAFLSLDIDMPGLFDDEFSGSGVGQGVSNAESGYAGGERLYAAYRGGRRIRRGKGYSLRLLLTGSRSDVEEALYCLWHYADTLAVANGDEPEYRRAKAACLTMRDRTFALAVAHGLDVSDWQ